MDAQDESGSGEYSVPTGDLGSVWGVRTVLVMEVTRAGSMETSWAYNCAFCTGVKESQKVKTCS